MALYMFSLYSIGREVAKIDERNIERLGRLLNISFSESCGTDGKFTPFDTSELERFLNCKATQCSLTLKDSNEYVTLDLGMLEDSASVVLRVNSELLSQKDQFQEIRNELMFYFDTIRSLSITEENQSHAKITNDTNIPRPSFKFGSGTEWYFYLSPLIWESHYDEKIVLCAPIDVKILDNGYLEWFSYDDPLHFNAQSATANRRYFGEHKKQANVVATK